MPRYRKLPVVITAEQFWPDVEPWPAGVQQEASRICDDSLCGDPTWDHYCTLGSLIKKWKISTLEGVHEVTPGDWIITGIKGEKYPCNPDIFSATYRLVTHDEMEPITPQEFAKYFHKAYWEMNLDDYTKHILCATPREGDIWQIEKFGIFQDAAQQLSRISTEYLERIIKTGRELCQRQSTDHAL